MPPESGRKPVYRILGGIGKPALPVGPLSNQATITYTRDKDWCRFNITLVSVFFKSLREAFPHLETASDVQAKAILLDVISMVRDEIDGLVAAHGPTVCAYAKREFNNAPRKTLQEHIFATAITLLAWDTVPAYITIE